MPRPRWIWVHGKEVHEPTDGAHRAFNRPTDRSAGPPSPRLISAFHSHPTPDVNAWPSGHTSVSLQCIVNISYAPFTSFRSSKKRHSANGLAMKKEISVRGQSADVVETISTRMAVSNGQETVWEPTNRTMSPIFSLSRAPCGKRKHAPCHICTRIREGTYHIQSSSGFV